MESMNPQVIYRDVSNYPGYKVGADGSVWSCRRPCSGAIGNTWHRLQPGNVGGGYLMVVLSINRKRKNMLVHRLVLEAFHGPCPDGMEALHFPDQNPSNCAISNLHWGTAVANAMHRDLHGNTARGEGNGNSQLSENDIREIRAPKGYGCVTRLAKRFGVSRQTINAIRYRKTWRHVV